MSLCKSPIASWLPEHVVMLTHLRNFVTFFFPSAQLCYLIRSGEYLHWLFINGNFCLRDPYFQSIICHLSRKQLIGFHSIAYCSRATKKASWLNDVSWFICHHAYWPLIWSNRLDGFMVPFDWYSNCCYHMIFLG